MAFSPPVQIFFLSVVLGASFGVLWDLIRIVRVKLNLVKHIVLIFDVAFFVIAATVSLLFFYIFTSSGIRAFIILGEFLGFLLYSLTLHFPVFFILNFFMGLISNFFKILLKFSNKISSILTALLKKIIPIFKFFLQFLNKTIYNKVKDIFKGKLKK